MTPVALMYALLRDAPSPTAPITRDGARAAAQHELAKRAYHRNDPSLVQRVLSWIANRLGHLFDTVLAHAPGHGFGLAAVAIVVVVVIIAVAVKLHRPARAAGYAAPLHDATVLAARDHRARAERFAAEARYAEAVREWLRAIGRELEQRGVVDPRAGRTADELCAETTIQLPGVGADLRRATQRFDAIWYGARPAGPDDAQLLRALDRRVAGSHRDLLPTTAGAHVTADRP